MRLGILIPEFPTQTHAFFWRETQALESAGHRVMLLSTRRPKDACPHAFAKEAAARTHYVFPPTEAAAWGLARFAKRAPAVAKYVASLSGGARRRLTLLAGAACAADLAEVAHREQLAHLHVHSCADAAHVAAMAHLLSGLPYSLHLHGDLPVYGTDHPQKMRHAAFVAAAARPMVRQLVEDAGVPEERTCVMPMGVDTREFAGEPVPRTSELRLISVSRLAACKGHHYALQAVRDALDAQLSVRYDIVGSGEQREEIERDIERLGLGHAVRVRGPLGQAEVRAALRESHAFLLTSVGVGEASPVAVMESMACAVPAICSRIGGTPDMIESEKDGILVGQGSREDIFAAIRRIHDDEGFRLSLARAARQRAEREFDARVRARAFADRIAAGAGAR